MYWTCTSCILQYDTHSQKDVHVQFNLLCLCPWRELEALWFWGLSVHPYSQTVAYLAYLVRGGKRLGRARGDVYSGGSRICACQRAPSSYGWAEKSRGAVIRAPGVQGCRGQSPCRGPRSSRVFSKYGGGGGGGLSVLHFSCIIFYHSLTTMLKALICLKTRELPGDPPLGSQ